MSTTIDLAVVVCRIYGQRPLGLSILIGRSLRVLMLWLIYLANHYVDQALSTRLQVD